jgi:hypothetical protein
MHKLLTILPEFLRDPDEFFRSIQRNENVHEKALLLGLASLFSLLIFGFTTGLSHSLLQGFSSAIKMPILFLSSILFCLPALYFFSLALLGTPLRMIQVLTVVLSGIAVTSFLLLGLAPVTFFFVLTSENYAFFQLLTVIFVGLSSWIGVYFLWRGMTHVETARDDALKTLGRRILLLWIGLYAFIGTQMTWRLSPFIADPAQPFVWILPSRDNFYVDVIHAIQRALELPATQIDWLIPLGLGLFCIGVPVVLIFIGGMFISAIGSKKPKKEIQPAPTA